MLPVFIMQILLLVSLPLLPSAPIYFDVLCVLSAYCKHCHAIWGQASASLHRWCVYVLYICLWPWDVYNGCLCTVYLCVDRMCACISMYRSCVCVCLYFSTSSLKAHLLDLDYQFSHWSCFTTLSSLSFQNKIQKLVHYDYHYLLCLESFALWSICSLNVARLATLQYVSQQ